MSDTKINLTIVVPGATMMSEQECSKQLKKPVIIKNGKNAGKQLIKNGKPVFKTVNVPDSSKYKVGSLNVRYEKDGEMVKERIIFHVRGNREAKRVLNISQEAYSYFKGNEVPAKFRAPKDFKPKVSPKRVLIERQAWNAMSAIQRIEWHLNNIAESSGGKVDSYLILDD